MKASEARQRLGVLLIDAFDRIGTEASGEEVAAAAMALAQTEGAAAACQAIRELNRERIALDIPQVWISRAGIYKLCGEPKPNSSSIFRHPPF